MRKKLCSTILLLMTISFSLFSTQTGYGEFNTDIYINETVDGYMALLTCDQVKFTRIVPEITYRQMSLGFCISDYETETGLFKGYGIINIYYILDEQPELYRFDREAGIISVKTSDDLFEGEFSKALTAMVVDNQSFVLSLSEDLTYFLSLLRRNNGVATIQLYTNSSDLVQIEMRVEIDSLYATLKRLGIANRLGLDYIDPLILEYI